MIAVEAHAEGTIFPVRVHAGGKRNGILGIRAGSLQVSVTQVPEKGKANKAIVALLAAALNLRKSQLELVTGATSSQKRYLVRGMAPEELKRRVEQLGPRREERRS